MSSIKQYNKKITKLKESLNKRGVNVKLSESKNTIRIGGREKDIDAVLESAQGSRKSLELNESFSNDPKYQISFLLEKLCETVIEKQEKKLDEYCIPQFGTVERVICEDVDIEKAEIILATRNISNEYQKAIEKFAKMQVDEVMKLVERISEEYGRNEGQEFNDTINNIFNETLQTLRSHKEGVDDAIAVLQGETPEPKMADFGDEEDEDEPDNSDLENIDSQEGPDDEPLGRKRVEESMASQEEVIKYYNQLERILKHGDKRAIQAAEEVLPKGSGYSQPINYFRFLVDPEIKSDNPTVQDEQRAIKSFIQMGLDIPASPKGIVVRHFDEIENKLKDILNEKTPPGMEEFVEDPEVKKSFKDQYGDDWEEVLYATAWERYNEQKNESINEDVEEVPAEASYIVKSESSPLHEKWVFELLDEDFEILEEFHLTMGEAKKMCKEHGLKPLSPMQYYQKAIKPNMSLNEDGDPIEVVNDVPVSYDLVTDEEQVRRILHDLEQSYEDYQGLFVKSGDGDYEEVYGFEGFIPYNSKKVDKLN